MLTASGGWVAAVAIAILRGSRVLALRRAPTKDAGAGIWEIVSGRIEPGESPLDAATREVLEETGLAVDVDDQPVDAYSAERAGAPMLVVVYRATYRAGEVERSGEHDAHDWLTPDELEARGSPSRLVLAVRRASVAAQ